MARHRILAVFPDHPYPEDMGSRVRNLRILETLAGHFDLTIISLVHAQERLRDLGPVGGLGRLIPILAPHRQGRLAWGRAHLRSLAASLRDGVLRETFFQSPPELSRAVAGALDRERPRLVHAAYWYGLRWLRPFPRPPLWVVDTHDVQFERHERLMGRASPRERLLELNELGRYDHIVAITARDARTFRDHLGSPSPPIEVIGMGVDLSTWVPGVVAPARPGGPWIAFYGNLATAANDAGARHLLQSILPVLRDQGVKARPLLIGGGARDSLRLEAERAGGEASGFVPDPRPWLASASVLALSIRSGSGQRGRVIEALALGLPVIGYSQALEGLDLVEGEGILCAETTAQFVEKLAQVLRDPEIARRLGQAGRAAVERSYGFDATYRKFPVLYKKWIEEARSPSE